MDEQISSEAEKAQMELQAKDVSSQEVAAKEPDKLDPRKMHIFEFVGGMGLWLVISFVGVVILQMFSLHGSILFLFPLFNWLLIVFFLFKRRWMAFGMLLANIINVGLTLIGWTYSGNVLHEDIVPLCVLSLFGVPFWLFQLVPLGFHL